ncbi:PIN domain-containing protein [Treponema sp. TIM-1]|uniref:PIN domain-containing protein n=1 Tax=Treponema sp. TIM-1 TaxID=2898417 RepID=UPI0039801C87
MYAEDKYDKNKQNKARAIIKAIIDNEKPVISTQVLQEFYNASVTKLNIDKLLAKNILHDFYHMEVIQVNTEIIEQGIDISILSQISFWDGLIMASAEFAGCLRIISEDLNDGQRIRGIEIINPFK